MKLSTTAFADMAAIPGECAFAVIDAKTMKVAKTYPFGDNGGCNGLALDVKNEILIAACSANSPAAPRGAAPGRSAGKPRRSAT